MKSKIAPGPSRRNPYRWWSLLIAAICTVGFHFAAMGQEYPSKPIRMLTGDAGGSADFITRVITQGATSVLPQPIVVDNRGGTIIIQASFVARAAPDGYTLLCNGNNIWLVPVLQDDAPYDALRDLAAIILPAQSPVVVVVHPSIPVNSVADLIKLAKSHPGKLNYGSAGLGSTTQVSAELFNSMAGVKIVEVPYRGAGQALNALIGGQIDVMFATAGGVSGHLKSGRLKAIAVTTAHASTLFPGVPPVADSGVPGYESVSFYGIFGPAGMANALINRLNSDFAKVLSRDDVKEKLLSAGVETVSGSPDQLVNAVKKDMGRMRQIKAPTLIKNVRKPA